jgi:formate dehydrogenase subunit gamma
MPLDESTALPRIREIIADHQALEGPLLPILHAIQSEFGHVPQSALLEIAQALSLGKAEVHGVMSFYHDFRASPAGRHVIKICRAEACQSMGADKLAALLQEKLGIGWHETTADGAVTLEPVFCLGLCACAPSAMVDGKLVGRLDEETVQQIASEVRA